jgi:hypothetical protein
MTRMDNRSGGEEEQCFEEGMGHEVEDAGRVRADAAGQKHVAELRDSGVGEDALDIVLDERNRGSHECGERAKDGDDAKCKGRAVKQDVAARDHVNAGRDHGGRVDEGGDGCRAFHRVGQPDVKGNLGGLAGGADDEKKGDAGDKAAGERGFCDLGEDAAKAEGSEVSDEQEHREQEAEVADAVDDEGFLAGVRRGILCKIEADEQVGGEADAFPADEEQQEAGAEDQDQHEEHEEVQVGEEAPVTIFKGHITDGVEVDEEADAGDDGEHDQREVVDGEGEVDVKAGDGDPGSAADGEKQRSAGGLEEDPEFGHEDCWRDREEQGDGRDERTGQPSSQGSVEQEAGEGKQRDEPEQFRFHEVRDGAVWREQLQIQIPAGSQLKI